MSPLRKIFPLLSTAFFAASLALVDARAQTLTTIARFNGANGELPYAGLSKGPDGNFYGVTHGGGPTGWGVIYRVTPGGLINVITNFSVQSDFLPEFGPTSGLLAASDGYLYLAARVDFDSNAIAQTTVIRKIGLNGNGTVDRLAVLSRNSWENYDQYAFGPLFEGGDGKFYGFSTYGWRKFNATGEYSGSIFSMSAAGDVQTLFRFVAGDPDLPNTDTGVEPNTLVKAKDGNFYGTIRRAPGGSEHGAIFKFLTNGTTNSYSVLFEFNGTNGSYPNSFMQASDGNFYGTTHYGGSGYDQDSSDGYQSPGFGTVFKITPGGQHTVLAEFKGTNGAYPFRYNGPGSPEAGALVEGPDGSLYGTTLSGGLNHFNSTYGGEGTVFRVTRDGVLTTVADFGTNAGDFPESGVIFGDDGHLYGTTSAGGTNNPNYGLSAIQPTAGHGTVFRVSLADAPPGPTNNPTVSGFVPSSGPVGTAVSIIGGNLTGATAVKFNNVSALFNVAGATQISATVPVGATTGKISVTTPAGSVTSSSDFTVTVAAKTNQTITFAPLADQLFATNRTFALVASNSSGLPVGFFSANSNVVVVSNTTAIIKALGTVAITATNAGDGNFNPASASQTVSIKGGQTITFNALSNQMYGPDKAFALVASNSSGLPVSFASSDSNVVVISNATAIIKSAGGPVTITATNVGNAAFLPGGATRTVIIAKANQTIPAFAAVTNRSFGALHTLTNTVSSAGLPVSFSVTNGVLSNNTVRVTNVGKVTIVASQSGNANFSPAASLTNTFNATKANQTITFNPPATNTFAPEAVIALSASNSSGLPVTYSSANSKVLLISNNTAIIKGAGTAAISAANAGDANYNPAKVTKPVKVNKATQTISFNLPATVAFTNNGVIPLGGTSSSGLAVRYKSSNTKVLSISGTNAVMKGKGTATITASQSGNANYLAASNVVRSITVQ